MRFRALILLGKCLPSVCLLDAPYTSQGVSSAFVTSWRGERDRSIDRWAEKEWKVGDHVKLRTQPSLPFCFLPSAVIARARLLYGVVSPYVLCLS